MKWLKALHDLLFGSMEGQRETKVNTLENLHETLLPRVRFPLESHHEDNYKPLLLPESSKVIGEKEQKRNEG
ncbi:hypothetical protein, partial [Pseudomonas aeruginosa]|uniref:hypothetical protein n=1 Tax=Pseudomonas aeruginosa TaxID=287 RepID=UPI00067C4CEF